MRFVAPSKSPTCVATPGDNIFNNFIDFVFSGITYGIPVYAKFFNKISTTNFPPTLSINYFH